MRRVLVAALLAVGPLALLAPPAHAMTSGKLRVAATLGGRDVGKSTGANPIKLYPKCCDILLGLTITNRTSQDVTVRAARILGVVGGVTFFSYQVTLNTTVSAGGVEEEQVTVDFDGLEKQATGLIAGSVQLIDPKHHVLASQHMITDVRGNALSTYALCGMAVFLLTLLGFLTAIIGLAQSTLSANRFVRAFRFGLPAFGAGLFVVFLMSAFRIAVPRYSNGIPIVLIVGAIGFAIGYLTPTPETGDDETDDEELFSPAAGR